MYRTKYEKMNFYEYPETVTYQDCDDSCGLFSLPINDIGRIDVQYKAKHVRRLKVRCFASSGHTGLLVNPNQEAEEAAAAGSILLNGLSYRNNGENAALDKSIESSLSSTRVWQIRNAGEPVVIIGGIGNYGHFIFEFLPKIVQSLVLFGVRHPFVVNESIKRWLDLANIISSSYIDELPTYLMVPDASRLIIDDSILVESTRAVGPRFIWSDNILRITRDSALKYRARKQSTNHLLYLRRHEDSWRNIVNRQEIRSLCEQRGFYVVEMGRFTQAQQLDLLANCDTMIIEGGADSMAGSLCPQHCKIIELLPQGMLAGFGSASSHLALNQTYIRIYGRRSSVNKGRLSIDNDYVIDPDMVNDVLKRVS